MTIKRKAATNAWRWKMLEMRFYLLEVELLLAELLDLGEAMEEVPLVVLVLDTVRVLGEVERVVSRGEASLGTVVGLLGFGMEVCPDASLRGVVDELLSGIELFVFDGVDSCVVDGFGVVADFVEDLEDDLVDDTEE
uniref:Uncharacterized protein n=1 Tax=Cacopsylla melanoneura TaxID=428564 RepID=A0A8D8YXQ0_9HEMI